MARRTLFLKDNSPLNRISLIGHFFQITGNHLAALGLCHAAQKFRKSFLQVCVLHLSESIGRRKPQVTNCNVVVFECLNQGLGPQGSCE